jgi:hypothetical protein
VKELREGGSVSVQSVRLEKAGEGKPPEETSEDWRAWLAKPDKKRTQFQVGDQVVTAVFIGEHWWSWSPRGYITNDGALNSSHGFGPAEGLVDPARCAASLHMRVEGRSSLRSRPVFLVTAVPSIVEPHAFDPIHHMLGTGADLYKLAIDAESGVVLRSQAEFQGDAFRVVEVDEIAVDEPFGDDMFDPDLIRNGVIDP